jgi:hypothetical protein
MKIMIPTYMRETSQKCWDNLPESVRSRAYLCSRSDRVEILRENYPEANIIDIGETDGIADVRQRLVDHANGEKIMIVDDNCTFMYRDDEMKLKKMEDPAMWEEMLTMVEENLDTYAWVGISDRAGNNRIEEDLCEITRSYSCYGINTRMFNENDIRFDGMWQKDKKLKLFEDFYAILSMLKKGMKNAVIYKYAFNHPHGKEGGNSTFRNGELQEMCYKALAKEFPGVVKLTVKENASWTTDEDSTSRTEAIISWKKAFVDHSGASLDEFFG